jgi:hypothetical protein
MDLEELDGFFSALIAEPARDAERIQPMHLKPGESPRRLGATIRVRAVPGRSTRSAAAGRHRTERLLRLLQLGATECSEHFFF